ncbi:MAG TPA: MBL fold metallo-hydrolase, partial [Candidatus Acidoferrum sp.]|nr:MBL fold metallo-hydrolase [Candidatus Acidoferrum sp.]
MQNKQLTSIAFTAALIALAIVAAPRFVAAQASGQSQAQAMPAAQQQPPAQSQAPPPPLPFRLKELGHNVWAAIDAPEAGTARAGSNASFIIGDDGILVVDTFQKTSAAAFLLADIKRMTQLPIKYVVNTHYHIDHVTGNGVFAEAGAIIFAHKNVRDWIHVENLKFYGPNITPA